jgi:hypothetical protein
MPRTHGNKHIKKFVREIERLGFKVTNANNRYKMVPPAHLGTRVYTTHGTPQAIKPMCSDFKKFYNLDLDWRKFI